MDGTFGTEGVWSLLLHGTMRNGVVLCLSVLSVLGLGIGELVADSAPYCPKKTHPTEGRTETRGVWISNVDSEALHSKQNIEKTMENLSSQGFNTIYPVVWNKGSLFFLKGESRLSFEERFGKSPYATLSPELIGRDVLQEVIDSARGRGFKIIPWFEYGFKVHGDNELLKKRPELFSKKKSISNSSDDSFFQHVREYKFAYLNPFHPEAQKIIIGLLVDIVKNYDVDGIQVDDNFSLPLNFGYDNYTVDLYKSENAGNPPAWGSSEGLIWRARKFSLFVRELAAAVRKANPKAKINVAPNPWVFSYERYGQDWKQWIDDGSVDELVVQLYRIPKQTLLVELRRPEILKAKECIPVSVGLYVEPGNGGLDSLRELIQATRNENLDGFSLFHYGNIH
jgi:uncharacterized lipoprotein YddW (UPF0748 family)